MSFEPLAPYYNWMEKILAGEKLQQCRTCYLNRVTDHKRALLVGEGHGRFLESLVRAAPGMEITVLEQSKGMMAQARKRLTPEEAGRIHWVETDLLQPPHRGFQKPGYDLIGTHFFLDCFPPTELQRLIANLAQIATDQATWMISDFQLAPRGWKRVRCRLILWSMYRFFRMATGLPARELADPSPFLRSAGFERVQHQTFDWELLHSELWQRRGPTENA